MLKPRLLAPSSWLPFFRLLAPLSSVRSSPQGRYVFPESLHFSVPGCLRVHFRDQRRLVSPRSLTPQASGLDTSFLGGGGAARGCRAPQTHPAAVVTHLAAGEYG